MPGKYQRGKSCRISLQLDSNSDCVEVLRSIVSVMTARAGMDELRSNRVAVGVDELFANIAAHAYGGKPGRIEVDACLEERGETRFLIFDFRDYAKVCWRGDIEKIANQPLDVEHLCPGGLGLRLIHSVSDNCEHHELEDGNRWQLIFNVCNGEKDGHES
ncbi:Anti-sigma regulatory factor (Ser/Thr protein kinase) [Mariprofundus ferrinatatus]|uniref:Anti-sigma regulatory factor (Ser/Thr protein kinase) n=2 Tax=Mariprofundus ferrinatatus TaxID=1921087 RepID=A0A2K8L6S6_9PROT|nr:Anti-sigma regulatory factor (Ser/Thr protein kinase) [Mariprofundus ferrinatatus]